MEIFYYEDIACRVCETNVNLLFQKKKPDAVVLARQFCMIYRMSILNLSEKSAGERYAKDHATAHHAKTCIQNYIDTNHPRSKLYRRFLKLCREKSSQLKSLEGIGNVKEIVDNQLNEYGFEQFINKTQTLFYELISCMQKNDDEAQVRYLLEVCHHKIHELKYLYE